MIKNKWLCKTDGRRLPKDKIIRAVMNDRGISDVYGFLNPEETDILPLESFKNIKKAVKTFQEALEDNLDIVVYADVDLDGVSSAAIIYRYAKHFTQKVSTVINNGKEHGIENADISNFRDKLLIIVDSIQETPDKYIELLNQNTKIIVLDHHIVPRSVLEIQKDINLVTSAVDYGNSQLSGSGVCWKFACMCDKVLNKHYAEDLVDLAAAGIIGDMCSVGMDSMENRYICSLAFGKKPVNLAISKIVGSYDYNSQAVSFSIAPLVNASMRVGQNSVALNTFLSDDEKEVKANIKSLKSYKEAQNIDVDNVWSDIERQYELQKNNKCLFFEANCNFSVSGLIANKCLGAYKKPIFVVSYNEEKDQYSGSARGFSVGDEDFIDIVNESQLAKGLGHENAFGVFIDSDDFEAFRDNMVSKFNQFSDDMFSQTYDIDIKLSQKQITGDLIDQLKRANTISGMNFKPICVLIEDVTNYEIGNLGQGKHLKLYTDDMNFIVWNFNDWDSIPKDKSLSAIGTLDSSFWGGKFQKNLIMQDFCFEDRIEI